MQHQTRILTRRTFLTSLGAGALLLLTGGQGADTLAGALGRQSGFELAPVHEMLPIGAVGSEARAASFAQRFGYALVERLPGYAVLLPDDDPRDAPVIVSETPLGMTGREQSRISRIYGLVTNWQLPLPLIQHQALSAILTGGITDWAAAGSPVAGRIQRFAFSAAATVLPPDVITPLPATATFASYEALVNALDAAPYAFAIIPLDLIDFRVQCVAIDGLDPLAGRGNLASYPLREDLWLNWDPQLGSGLRDAMNAIVANQGYLTNLATPPGNPINVTVAGDIIFGRTVHSRMVRYNDFSYPLRLVAPRLRDADLTIADLECSMSDRTEKPDDPFTFNFTTNAAAVDGLVLAGIDGVSLANNHSMNFGKLGLEDTLDGLKTHGITAFGGGMTLPEARKPGIFTVKGVKFFFLGYDGITAALYGAGPTWPGTCPLDTTLLLEDIQAAQAASADLIIPFFHWSVEYVAVPSAAMRRIAHMAIDAGAAMVIGSHPHWVQATEWYKGKPILYSLGNFVFDQDWSLETKQGMFAEIVVRNRQIARVRLVPVLIEDLNRPRILEGDEAVPVLERVYEATAVVRQQGPV